MDEAKPEVCQIGDPRFCLVERLLEFRDPRGGRIAERDQLVHQIASRLAGEAGEIVVFCPLALPAVAGLACAQARLHRVGCAFRRRGERADGSIKHQRHA